MKKVIELIIHKKSWGATSGDVLEQAYAENVGLNMPAPFCTEVEKPDMAELARRMKDACDKATAGRRKGMMISSRFRVEHDEAEKAVHVYHVLNEHDPVLFLTLKQIKSV
jgi:hypothetical protein